uniref:Uncharacterized protein n=1 Tax=Neogobius melanostomus TaxID=47308 RepID=A0A8C6T264_9GOBI
MSVELRGPLVRRPISTAGHDVILDALHILSPKSRDLSNTDELLSFLQELRAEGHRPTVLQSKDVYRIPLLHVCPKEVHPSWSCERSRPRIQGVRPPEPRLGPKSGVRLQQDPGASQDPPVQPCLRLTNIQGQSGYHTARLQVQPTFSFLCKTLRWPPAALLPPSPLRTALPAPAERRGGPVQSENPVVSRREVRRGADRGLRARFRPTDSRRAADAEQPVEPQQRHPPAALQPEGDAQRLEGEGQEEPPSQNHKSGRLAIVAEARLKAQKILQIDLSVIIHPDSIIGVVCSQ